MTPDRIEHFLKSWQKQLVEQTRSITIHIVNQAMFEMQADIVDMARKIGKEVGTSDARGTAELIVNAVHEYWASMSKEFDNAFPR